MGGGVAWRRGMPLVEPAGSGCKHEPHAVSVWARPVGRGGVVDSWGAARISDCWPVPHRDVGDHLKT